jgi:hypothetical protein
VTTLVTLTKFEVPSRIKCWQPWTSACAVHAAAHAPNRQQADGQTDQTTDLTNTMPRTRDRTLFNPIPLLCVCAHALLAGEQVTLEGRGAYDAAVHCASISAGQNALRSVQHATAATKDSMGNGGAPAHAIPIRARAGGEPMGPSFSMGGLQ